MTPREQGKQLHDAYRELESAISLVRVTGAALGDDAFDAVQALEVAAKMLESVSDAIDGVEAKLSNRGHEVREEQAARAGVTP